MYSRSYYADETTKPALPDNYQGTAFMDQPEDRVESVFLDQKEEVAPTSCRAENQRGGLSGIPILSSLFGHGAGFNLQNIGIEEILIIATAAFLFFSKDGDKESAIILLLLLLVN